MCVSLSLSLFCMYTIPLMCKSGRTGIHLSVVLSLPPVRALTGIIGDLKKAVELRTSEIIKVSNNLLLCSA